MIHSQLSETKEKTGKHINSYPLPRTGPNK